MRARRSSKVLVTVAAVAVLAGCGTTIRLTDGDGASGRAVVSADGRYLLFESDASDLVPGDDNGERDLFTVDRTTGVTLRITDGDGSPPPDTPPFEADMSADGRYVTFHSFASDVVPGDDNGHADVFSWDRTTGATVRITDGDEDSGQPAISADGRHITFTSLASDLVSGDGDPLLDIFTWDRTTGTTTRLTDGVGHSLQPAISGDGRHITFWTDPLDGTADGIWSWDRTTGATTRVSTGRGSSPRSALSADGRYITFFSSAEDQDGPGGLFLWDRATGEAVVLAEDADPLSVAPISADGRRVAVTTGEGIFLWQRPTGDLTRLAPGPGEGLPAISADGFDVAYASSRDDVAPDDTNQVADIFVWSDRP